MSNARSPFLPLGEGVGRMADGGGGATLEEAPSRPLRGHLP